MVFAKNIYDDKQYERRNRLGNLLWEYWDGLPEPKMSYSEWWLGEGGLRDMLDKRHLEVGNDS